jgi:DNA replication protein DnaC
MKQQLSIQDFSRQEKRRKALELETMIHCDFVHDNGENPAARELAQRIVQHFPALRQNGTGLFLFGGPRAGKSFLGAEIVNELTDRGYKCYMTSLLGLFNYLSNCYGETRSRFLEKLFGLDLLVLDDFGLQAATQLNDQTLMYIVVTCQKLHIPLIVITHNHPDALMQAGGDGKPPELLCRIRRCCLDFNVIMPGARRSRLLQMKKETRRMLNVETANTAPVQQELPLK